MVDGFPQAQVPGDGADRSRSALATRRWSSKAIWMRSGCSSFLVGFLFQKPSSQIQRSTLLPFQEGSHTRPFGGLELRIPKRSLERCGYS